VAHMSKIKANVCIRPPFITSDVSAHAIQSILEKVSFPVHIKRSHSFPSKIHNHPLISQKIWEKNSLTPLLHSRLFLPFYDSFHFPSYRVAELMVCHIFNAHVRHDTNSTRVNAKVVITYLYVYLV